MFKYYEHLQCNEVGAEISKAVILKADTQKTKPKQTTDAIRDKWECFFAVIWNFTWLWDSLCQVAIVLHFKKYCALG